MPKRRHTEFHPRLSVVDGVAELLDKLIHIVAAPVADSHSATVGSVVVAVGDGDARHGIGIEIVVDVQSVDIIAPDDIVDNLTYIFAVHGQRRIEDILSVVAEDALGVYDGNMVRCQRRCRLCLCAVGVYPRVQFHSSLVALGNHPCQRVPPRVLSLAPGEKLAPRLVAAAVEGVALSPHLKDDGVGTVLLQFVELIRQRALHIVFESPWNCPLTH